MMHVLKQKIIQLFFVIEVMVFAGVYLFGAQGIQALLRLKRDNNELDKEIKALQTEVAHLEQQIDVWNAHPFYKEKIAREQLQMARPDDQIYYLT